MKIKELKLLDEETLSFQVSFDRKDISELKADRNIVPYTNYWVYANYTQLEDEFPSEFLLKELDTTSLNNFLNSICMLDPYLVGDSTICCGVFRDKFQLSKKYFDYLEEYDKVLKNDAYDLIGMRFNEWWDYNALELLDTFEPDNSYSFYIDFNKEYGISDDDYDTFIIKNYDKFLEMLIEAIKHGG